MQGGSRARTPVEVTLEVASIFNKVLKTRTLSGISLELCLLAVGIVEMGSLEYIPGSPLLFLGFLKI